MEDSQRWVCIHVADSFPEAVELRSLLENKGIRTIICSIPSPRLHDYLHDKEERVRIFVPAEDLAKSQQCKDDVLRRSQQESVKNESIQ